MARQAAAILARAAKAALVDVSDRDLLKRYVELRDQHAFAEVVRRHSSMIYGVCRRALPTQADAEDAVQAVFLLLANKASSIRWQSSIANWLYETARKVSANARREFKRRAHREGSAAVPEVVPPADPASIRELGIVLDEELERLSATYREPLVLCYLEGLTRDEAALQLMLPIKTLNKRLERGRKQLADLLTARGYGLGVALLLGIAPIANASQTLLHSILATVGGSPSAAVSALVKGVALNGIIMKAKLGLMAMVGITVLSFGFASMPSADEPAKPVVKPQVKPEAQAVAKAEPKKPEAKERTIKGMVVNSEGKPIVAELQLIWIEGKPLQLGKTDADGNFKVTVPLTQTDYGGWLIAKAPGYGIDFLGTGFDWKPNTMTATADVTMKLAKERPIKGRFLDQQGKPVSGAKVVVNSIAAFESIESMNGHLKRWGNENFLHGVPPDGDRSMYFPGERSDLRANSGRSPYTATTDPDGRYAIQGIGVGQLVNLRITGDGVADREIITLNLEGFDPEPINKLTRQHAYKAFGGKWQLDGPDPTIVLDPEKIIRGRVTDHEGKPRAGVRVAFTRPNKRDLTQEWNQAITGKDGMYEIRGARKHKGYMVEVPPDITAGLMACQGFAEDTIGNEPITINIKQAKGVIIKGRVTNKSTGEPVTCQMYTEVVRNNPFVEKFPPFRYSASGMTKEFQSDRDGRFRVVVIPGPVLLMAGPSKGARGEFKPAAIDPKFAEFFTTEYGGLSLFTTDDSMSVVHGSWCKVVETKPSDTELTVNVELVPSMKTLVKVVDADRKPVTGCQATGVNLEDYSRPTEFPGDTLTVFNLDLPMPGRKRSNHDLNKGKPKEEGRLLVVFHEKRQLVGTLTLTAETKDPVVTLGKPGTLTGRVIGKDGKPIAGIEVMPSFVHRQATKAHLDFKKKDVPTTDANGEFQVDSLFIGQEFRLVFVRNRQSIDLDVEPKASYRLTKSGETRKAGDFKIQTPVND
jgi:RNA polymerase sigma factor (sigma-70 family)